MFCLKIVCLSVLIFICNEFCQDEDDFEYDDEDQPGWAGSDLDGLAIANFMMVRIILIN